MTWFIKIWLNNLIYEEYNKIHHIPSNTEENYPTPQNYHSVSKVVLWMVDTADNSNYVFYIKINWQKLYKELLRLYIHMIQKNQ